MSNIGKQKIHIPEDVTIKFDSKDNQIHFSGKQGTIAQVISDEVKLSITDKEIKVASNNKQLRGTERSRIQNSIIGVSQGFYKSLKLVGIGYRAQIVGKCLTLKIGFSHDVIFNIPEGITAVCPKPDQIVLFGREKDFLTKIASEIRNLKKPDPYKGKGIRFEDEILILKEGKKK